MSRVRSRHHRAVRVATDRRLRTGALAACAAALFVGGLAARAGSSTVDPVGTWGSTEQGQPHLTFSDDNRVSGNDGCNTVIGEWSVDGDTVDFGPLGSTRMFCEGVDAWLEAADSATIEGTTLHVFDASGAEIGTLPKA